jgi:hypothetical protein
VGFEEGGARTGGPLEGAQGLLGGKNEIYQRSLKLRPLKVERCVVGPLSSVLISPPRIRSPFLSLVS